MNSAKRETGVHHGIRRCLLEGAGYALMAAVALAYGAGSAAAQNEEEAENMRLVGHNDLQARSAYQPIIQKQDGRWIAYVGHHNGEALNPLTGVVERNGVSIVDVTNPRDPKYLHHLPAEGDPDDPEDGGAQMVQTCTGDQLPDGDDGTVYLLRTNGNFAHEIWDVTDPSAPEQVSTIIEGLDGTHKNWWECETGIGYLVAGLEEEGFATNRGLKVYDLSDPANPVFIRNFTPPEVAPGAPESEREFSLHEATVLGDRVYLGYGTSSDGVCQILDRTKLLEGDPDAADPFAPTEENLLFPQISRLDMPGFWGCHTYWPLIDLEIEEFKPWEEGSPRDFAVAVNESTANQCQEEMHQMVFFVDITDPEFPWPVSNYHVEEDEGMFCDRGGRFGAHSMNWSFTPVFYKKLIFVSYFNAGARAVDVRNPYHPKEVGFYIPATTANTDERCIEVNGGEECKIAIQTNNVEVDDRGFIYLADRANTGLHIVELTGEAREIADLSFFKK